MSKAPKTFMHCIRCDKDVTYDPIHTCTPSERYRAGMNEGEIIQQKLNVELQAKYGMALAFITSLARNAHEAHPITVPMIAKELLRELGEVE